MTLLPLSALFVEHLALKPSLYTVYIRDDGNLAFRLRIHNVGKLGRRYPHSVSECDERLLYLENCSCATYKMHSIVIRYLFMFAGNICSSSIVRLFTTRFCRFCRLKTE